ncbi:unnamed protein product [Polarella glacialis]|uniref:Uncharacterized protein n=1 Tax=Polarella glacialis TaxID=89957 RepID=A0A813EH15_POLGL|nr:unnamed protein product [Polarella glacialis]
MKMLGARGFAGQLRLNADIYQEPGSWKQWMDGKTAEAPGSDLTGLPLSMLEYGDQMLRLGEQVGLEKMWTMLAALHKWHRLRYYTLVGARIGHCLEDVMKAVGDNRSWNIAWRTIGLPDPRP